MANLVSEKLNNVYKLLTNHKFQIISTVDDEMKCEICKNILVNAYQTICECNFCHKCIHEYISNGGVFCPGYKEECKLENLSNIATNHKVNKLISKLIVNCCQESCSYQCKLVDMEEHLSTCSSNSSLLKKSEITNEKFAVLIDLMKNFRKEIIELKTILEKSNEEIKQLKEIDRRKDERIELLNTEIQSFRKEIEDLTEQMEIGNRNLWYKFDEISLKITNDSKDGNAGAGEKMECRRLIEECKEKREKFNEENEKCILEFATRIEELEKFCSLRDDGILRWQLGKISEIEERMSSGYFYNRSKPCRMELQLKNANDELIVWLSIYNGACDADLDWPFSASITISLLPSNNNNNRHVDSMTSSELCVFEKPSIDSYEASELFTFSHSDLNARKLLNANCCIKCEVEFE